MTPPIRFVRAADGTQLAYAVYGDGPPLVWVAHWLTHLELDWESPVWRHFVRFFTRHHRLLRYDERGCGLSDWVSEGFSLENFVGDLEAVVDAAGLDEFALLGISQGGPVAIEFSARHPERVSKLVLLGTFPDSSFMPAGRREALATLMETGWGQSNPVFRQMFTSLFIPGATQEQQEWFNELQRRSTKPEIAASLMRSFRKMDVRDRLAELTVPTLVMHADEDAAITFGAGRTVAAEIPGARFVPLRGNNHLPLEGTPAWESFCREMREFLGDPSDEPAVSATADTDLPASTGENVPAQGEEPVYVFGRCRLDLARHELFRDEQPVPIERRSFDLLAFLIRNRQRAVTKDELQEAVWPGMILTESALTRCVMKARRAVGDDSRRQAVIKTIHGHGYRFVAGVNDSR